MDLTDARAQLAEVDDLIARARRAASYSTGDVSVTRQSLADLQSERSRLQRLVNELEAIELGVSSPDTKVVDLPWP